MRIFLALLFLSVLMPTHPGRGDTAQSGIKLTITPDANGNPQCGSVNLFGGTNYFQVWGTGLVARHSGVTTFSPPVPITAGQQYSVNMSGTLTVPALTAQPIVPSVAALGYVLAFDDEFNQGNINEILNWWGINGTTARWTAHQPSGGNDLGNGWDGIWNPSTPARTYNLSEDSQGLLMQEWWEPSINHFVSALISSKDQLNLGFSAALAYWEFKFWAPPLLPGDAPNTTGLWSSCWLDSDDGLLAHPGQVAEIDIMEAYSVDYTKFHCVVHNWGGSGSQDQTISPGYDISAGWHVYSCLIKSDFIYFYLDGVQVGNPVPTPASSTRPLHARADVAFGGGWPTSNLSTTGIYQGRLAYVRCWTPQ